MENFDFITDARLKKELEFLVEIDKMKNIFRRTVLIDGSRRENDAEHSWHFAMYALILSEYSGEDIDVSKTIKIALIHDLVEVYAGDTFAYDKAGHTDKRQRETDAAEKLFGMLEDDQRDEIRALWDEFEAKETAEAKFANLCDRLQPLIHNFMTEGYTWKEGNIHSLQVRERMDIIKQASPELWQVADKIIELSVKNGYLLP